MKTLQDYIFEAGSDNNWLDSFLSKIEGLNTDGKLEQQTPLYGIFVDYTWNRCEVRDGYGRLMDEKNAMNHISTATITSISPIFVVTTDKGNFYGVTNAAVKNKTELAALFKNRVKGATKMVFTKSLDNVRKYIEKTTTWVKTLDELPSAEKVWMYGYGAYTTKEKAREAASKLSKLHKMNTKIKWYDEKSAELEATIKQREESIKYYEENIERVKKEIEEIKNDLAEYKLAKDLASTDLNESMMLEAKKNYLKIDFSDEDFDMEEPDAPTVEEIEDAGFEVQFRGGAKNGEGEVYIWRDGWSGAWPCGLNPEYNIVIRYTSGGKDLFFGVDDAYEMHDGDCLVLQGVGGNEID